MKRQEFKKTITLTDSNLNLLHELGIGGASHLELEIKNTGNALVEFETAMKIHDSGEYHILAGPDFNNNDLYLDPAGKFHAASKDISDQSANGDLTSLASGKTGYLAMKNLECVNTLRFRAKKSTGGDTEIQIKGAFWIGTTNE